MTYLVIGRVAFYIFALAVGFYTGYMWKSDKITVPSDIDKQQLTSICAIHNVMKYLEKRYGGHANIINSGEVSNLLDIINYHGQFTLELYPEDRHNFSVEIFFNVMGKPDAYSVKVHTVSIIADDKKLSTVPCDVEAVEEEASKFKEIKNELEDLSMSKEEIEAAIATEEL